MLPFNTEFQNGEARITQIRLSVLLTNNTLLYLTEQDVMLGGFVRDSSTTVDGEFTIGAAVTGKLKLIINNSEQTYSPYDFRAAKITASLGGQLSDETYQLVQVGIYTVDEYTYDGSNITLTAYDNFYKFDLPCKDSSITFPQTIKQLVDAACAATAVAYPGEGVTLANATIPNGSYSVTQKPEQWDTMTWHDVIAYCAQIACCFSKILTDGRLYFAWYDTSNMGSGQLDGGVFDGGVSPIAWLFDYMNTEEDMTSVTDTYADDAWYSIDNSIGFVFDGNVSTKIFITSNSAFSFANSTPSGSSYSTNFNVNLCHRDGSVEYIKSQVITEGSLSAIKVKFSGHTRYGGNRSTANELEYEIFFTSLGEIVINFIKYPTDTSALGVTSIVDNSVSTQFDPAKVYEYAQKSSSGAWVINRQSGGYITGAWADGGDFTYTNTDSYDGGHFGDRDNTHVLGSLYDLTVDTDDCMITGVSVLLSKSDNINATDDTEDYTKTLGSAGYVIRIESNPLIETVGNADSVCSYIYDILNGMRFRPLSASILENPAVEAGDAALVIDRYDNTYACYLSRVTYTSSAATSISCDSVPSMQNLKARYGEAEKTRAFIQRSFDKSMTDAESAMSTILTALATTMGLYQYTQSDGHGGTIYIYGNKNTLAASNIRWKFSAGAVMVSSDYGVTWNGAFSSDGIAVLQEVYAVKVNADNIVAGTITGRTISGGTINGSTINAGGTYGGGLTVQDSNGNEIAKFEDYVQKIGGFNVSSNALWYGKQYIGDYSHAGVIFTNSQMEIGSTSKSVSLNGSNEGGIYATGQIVVWGASESQMPWGAPIRVTNNYDTTGIGATQAFFAGDIYVDGDCDVGGEKPRAVDTDHYGSIRMYAFETSSPYFADIGSGVVSEDGTVTIFFDTIFEETVDTKVDYQVFLTRTSEAETSWVDKQNGYFIVHGEPGATFDWMVSAHQSGYVTTRNEPSKKPDNVNNDPIIRENNTVIDILDRALEQYDSELEVLA